MKLDIDRVREFCRFIDNYEGEMIIRKFKIYDVNNNLIYEL